MLEFMRRSAHSFFVKALLGLLIVSFGVWGVGDVFNNRGGSTAVATVGDISIDAAQFKSELAREVQRVQQLVGPQITREQAIAMGVGDMLMKRMVTSAVISAGASDMRLFVTEAAILNEIKNSKTFFNDAGVFDRRIFTQLLSNNGLSEAGYVQYVRETMERSQFESPIRTGVVTPKALADALYTYGAEKRVLDVLRINHSQIKNVPQPSGSELATYHEANAANFMAPEYRALTAVILKADDIAKTITVSEDQVQAAYDERMSDFMTPETRTLKQILVSDEMDAGRAAQLLDDGKTVADVATEVGANPAMLSIGSMTHTDASALSTDLADAAFALAVGGHSAPVKSPLGWHVIVVEDIQAGTVKTLEDVKDILTKDTQMSQALSALFDLSNNLQDLLGSGMTFEEAASQLAITLVKVQAVDANGLTPENTKADMPYAADILKEAVKLQATGESSLIESSDNSAFFVVRVDSVIPPALRPLETIKDSVVQSWTAEKRTDMAATIATTAKTRLESGEDLMAVAKDLGFDGFVTSAFNRKGEGLKQGALPAQAITEAFSAAQGGVVQAPGTGAHTVARVQSIDTPTASETDPLYAEIKDQTLTGLQNDLAQQLNAALQTRFPVRINQTALQQVY